MKVTIDELTKRATEKEAGMVHQVALSYVHSMHDLVLPLLH